MARRSQPTSFPHPVVGIGDDVKGELRCNAPDFDFGVDTTTLYLNGLEVTNPTIAGLVRNKEAAFTIRVSCGATYYRESFQSHDAQLQITLPAAKLLGDVELQVRVCALKKLEGYRPEQLHPDYGERSFSVQVGDVLAVGDDFAVRAEKQFDPLAADIPSIMRIVRGKRDKGPFEVNFDTDQILIYLSVEDHDLYGLASNVAPDVIHAALVLPVLSEAIARVRRRSIEDDMMTGLNWYRRLDAMLEARRIDEDESPMLAAQKLLEMPLSRALKNILKGSEDD